MGLFFNTWYIHQLLIFISLLPLLLPHLFRFLLHFIVILVFSKLWFMLFLTFPFFFRTHFLNFIINWLFLINKWILLVFFSCHKLYVWFLTISHLLSLYSSCNIFNLMHKVVFRLKSRSIAVISHSLHTLQHHIINSIISIPTDPLHLLRLRKMKTVLVIINTTHRYHVTLIQRLALFLLCLVHTLHYITLYQHT